VLKFGHMNLVSALRNGDLSIKTAYKQLVKRENVMNINGFEELSYLKNYDSLLSEIKNVEKMINDAGCTTDINPRFCIENNKISFDMRISLPFSLSRTEGKAAK